MPEVNPKCYHISASSIGSFKKCPTAFRLGYREGLRSAVDTDSQRQGSSWHALFEAYGNAVGSHDEKFAVAVEHLNQRYAKCPPSISLTDWAVEQQVLLVSFVAYFWFWQNDPVETLASEIPFNLPVIHPMTGMPLPLDEVVTVGKIDHLIKWRGSICVQERKSTSRSIVPESDYWDKSKKDTQVSVYALACRTLREEFRQTYKIAEGRFGGTLYDAWHKPTIKPAMLTQANTAAFIASGEYMGQKFKVEQKLPTSENTYVTVDGEPCEVERGKKGFAIRETPTMFAARLLVDIQERPDFYFQRREIARTDQELDKFRKTLYSVYQCMKVQSNTGNWYEDESQCRATFPCAYIPICYSVGSDAVCDGKTIPPGFRRIYVDLTVNGSPTEEE